jgi:acid phosphatase
MPAETSPRPWGLICAALAVGVVIGLVLVPQAAPPNPALHNLDASLWQQTSGEYRALCLQTYRFATDRLREKMEKLKGKKADKPPGVIMDLDETVFDNSPTQTYLLRTGSPPASLPFDDWADNHALEVKAVPGAVDFIAAATEVGATVHFISNRTERNRAGTVKSLANLKIPTNNIAGRLLLAKDRDDVNKNGRRDKVRDGYNVLMYVGDNLRDFDDNYAAKRDVSPDDPKALREAIKERKDKVDADADKWGTLYVVIPNPTYGEWTKLAGRDPVKVLNDSTLGGR